MSKCIIVDQRVEKFGKYGLYNDHDVLRCKPCEREDNITHHILKDLHDRNCAKHIANGAPYVLAPAHEELEERRKRKAEEKKERSKKQMLGEYQAQKWDMEREKQRRAAMVDLQKGKRQKMHTGQDVVLPYELSGRLTVQMVLHPKEPRFFSDDMYFTLRAHGRSLQLMDEMCPLFGTYNTVGGHVCGKSQGETYIGPKVIRPQRQAVLDLLRTNLSGAVMSLLFDETTYCTDKHPINIILATRYVICYITTALRDGDVNDNTVADAISTAQEPVGLPRTRAALVLFDNAG